MERASTPGDPIAGLPWAQLCDVTWQATSRERRALHATATGSRCPTRAAPYGTAASSAERLGAECRRVGCIDLFHDVLLGTRRRLHELGGRAATIEDPVRYAHVVAKRLLSDRHRSERVRLGWPARPGRSDGSAARVNESLYRSAPDRAEWLVTLFRMLRDYAHKIDRATPTWPLDGWVDEKSRIDKVAREPGRASRAEIRADIAEVLGVAEQVLGPTWVHVHIYHPLLSAMRPKSIDETLEAPTSDHETVLLSAWLRSEYGRRRRQGLAADAALRQAAHVVAGVAVGSLDPETRLALVELDDALGLAGAGGGPVPGALPAGSPTTARALRR